MALRIEYNNYLEHFGKTICLHEFADHEAEAIALRHDIDHCIDTALEMAFWEAELDIRSTYFILNTAPYRDDPRLLEKCLQIQNFGHEIGIHNNSITQWYESGIDPYEELARQLQYFRAAGVNIRGTSAHGDAACYRNNFINYWLFSDLRVEPIGERESRLNAEGIFEPRPEKRIIYPESHCLVRSDDELLELWRVTQESLGLTYEASHLQADAYYSDSGGWWKRTPDPLHEDLRNKRVQVLVHPIHWKAPKKVYFFLSTARSGSKWLSSILDQASSCDARHEYTLNHFTDGDDEVVAEKMTGTRLHELLASSKKLNQGLEHTRYLVDMQANDYAEANVYLPLILEKFIEVFPDAQLIHVVRNPADVVRSIMNRGWYDSPHDTAHPKDLETNWDALSPFEKCCSYVMSTNKLLAQKCGHRLEFEPLVNDCEYLKSQLKQLGIAYYPQLAKPLLGKKINANQLNHFPHYSQWPIAQQTIYNRYMSEIDAALQIGNTPSGFYHSLKSWLKGVLNKPASTDENFVTESAVLFHPKSANQLEQDCFTENIRLEADSRALKLTVENPAKNAHILLRNGTWKKLKRNAGWKLFGNGYYTLSTHCILSEDLNVSLFCLYYDKRRKLVFKRLIGKIFEGERDRSFSFAMMGNGRYFNIAIYLPAQEKQGRLTLSDVSLSFRPY